MVSELQRQGVDVWMMSGDSVATVNSVGQQLGIRNIHGGKIGFPSFILNFCLLYSFL